MFVISSDTLNSNVLEMTSFVDKLGCDIKSSLQSVSDVGRKMEGIGHKLNAIIELPETQKNLLIEFKSLHEQLINFNQSLCKSIIDITNAIPVAGTLENPLGKMLPKK